MSKAEARTLWQSTCVLAGLLTLVGLKGTASQKLTPRLHKTIGFELRELVFSCYLFQSHLPISPSYATDTFPVPCCMIVKD
ncbi:hypothetical protein BO82DRAFT_359137 [Aspergillus uvarum CBS 121591]|uniref:Uncharacterized protein n=1 Tax=Aspergillus uvarum CBS 121591 TaxID=1448315 RepID=A0A319BVJ5_9EURO|nr:hypothetical protein BO82DRAFT_359137 [Aspergillus uvarum CBS 121591]PYH76421.1 hypothetical protein BO82DRAFT_359137 [Aspergillus uvarum CBS 121591]